MTKSAEQNLFWDFSLLHYAKPGVPEVCLVLQDEYQLSVNMLLFGLWLADNSKALDMEPVERSTELKDCRQRVLLPLRTARYGMKQTGLNATQAALYQDLKQAELKVERIEHDLLYAMANQMPPDNRSAALLAQQNIEAYLASMNGDIDRGATEIDRLIQLVFNP